MYLIVAKDYTIYDSRDLITYPVSDITLELGLNDAGSLSFKIYPDHPNYNRLRELQTFVTVYRDDEELFYGRVLTIDKEIDDRFEVNCEGALTFLLDSEMEKGEYNETITAFIQRCVNAHNSQVEIEKQFTIGQITAQKATENKSYNFNLTSYEQTKSVLESQVLNRFGGFFRVRANPNGPRYLDYLEDYGRVNTQPIKIAVNIEERDDHISSENIFTILRPIGRQSGESSDMTIASLSQSDVTLPNVVKDGTLLKLTDKIALYGSITKTEEFNAPTTALDLLREAEEYITRRGTQQQTSIDITFVDFYHLNSNVMDVRLGDQFTTIEGYENKTLTVTTLTLDLENPANDALKICNDEEINAGRLNSFGQNSGGSSSSSLSSRSASSKSQEAFRYKYIHENQDQLILATKDIQINAEEQFSVLTNQAILTVQEVDGKPGKFMVQAKKGINDPAGATMLLEYTGFYLNAGDGEPDIDGYTRTSEFNVTKENLTTLYEKTGVDELGVEETMYSRITQTAEMIDREVSRATAAEGTLSTRVQETADGVATATGRLTEVEGKVSEIEGSALWVRRDSITGITGKMEVDENDNLVIKDGAGFRARYGNAEYGIYNENNLTAGIIVDKINGGTTTIQGNLVNIDANTSFTSLVGDVQTQGTAIEQNKTSINLKVDKGDVLTQLAVEAGNVSVSGGNLVVDGYITSDGLITTMGAFGGSISATGNIAGLSLSGGSITLNGETLSSHTLNLGNKFWMVASDQIINLSHYHTVTFSDGKFTIGGETDTAPGPFDITATTWYKNQIAAARPHSLESITLSSSDTGSSVKKTVTVFCEDDEEYDLSTTINASAVYTAGKNAMGVVADADNQQVKADVSSTKSLTISATSAISYSTSTHQYTATGTAKAGGTTIHTASAVSGTEGYDAGVTAGQSAMGVVADANSQQVSAVASSTKSLTISASASISYSSSTHKYTATGTAKAGGTTMDTASSVSGTQAYDAGVAAGESTGYDNGYADGVNDGYKTGWNAAVAKISRSGNSIIGPKTSNGSTYTTETKYTANYTASSYTKETHSYTASSYTKETHSYTQETTAQGTYTGLSSGSSYTASSHSHSGAWVRQDSGSKIYTDTTLSLSGDHSVTFDSGSDSYTASSYTQETTYNGLYTYLKTASSHSYTASKYTASSHSYTASKYTASSFSWS